MKRLKAASKTFLIIFLLTFFIISCSKEGINTKEVSISETQDVLKEDDSGNFEAKISSIQWRVQTLGKSYDFTSKKIPSKRYKRDGTKSIWMKVVASDNKIKGSSKYARTELRGLKDNFSTEKTNKMYVTMNVIKSSSKVVIGQIFGTKLKSSSGATGTDYGVVFYETKNCMLNLIMKMLYY